MLPLDHPLGRGINFQIAVPNLAFVATALAALGVPVFREAIDTWYATTQMLEKGQRELLVQDPDGYLLRFAESLGFRQRAS